MTLIEFLAARIAEDEATADEWPQNGWWRRYVLAECETKRRIVELHEHRVEHDPTNGGDWSRATLQTLATAYASHPDYRAEWRP